MASAHILARWVPATALLSTLWAATAVAECPAIDFESRAIGTAITNQYDGVVFSVVPQSCGGSPMLYMRVVAPVGGTSSGTKAIQIDTGCPDFSPDYVRMQFSSLHRKISFTIGESTGAAGYDFVVRYYSDSALLGTLSYDSGNGCRVIVNVGTTTGPQNIRRVEVQSVIGAFEVIDDLRFESDTTPPVVNIESPAFEACAYGTVQIRGVLCEPDGAYAGDKLEYLRVDAAPGTAWTLVDDATTEVCTTGPLYFWNTTALTHGYYYARITASNECGLTATAVVVVYVDREFDTVEIRSPAEGGVIGGTVCIDGTVWDHLCFDQYTVEYQPFTGGAWSPVDPAHPEYNSAVLNDPFASWATRSGIVDGSYRLRVSAADVAGNTETATHVVAVDNTRPITVISAPSDCGYWDGVIPILGTVSDTHLGQWSLDWTGGTSHGWTRIASGNSSVVAGPLGTWNASALPGCSYTLRLRAEDTAVLDCNSASHNTSEYYVSISLRLLGDLNCDGVVSVGDISPFVLALTDAPQYETTYPHCEIRHGDMDENGVVSVGDIGGFVDALTGA